MYKYRIALKERDGIKEVFQLWSNAFSVNPSATNYVLMTEWAIKLQEAQSELEVIEQLIRVK